MDGRILDYNMWRFYTVITHPKISQVSFPDKQRFNAIMFYLDLLKLKPTFFHRVSKGCKGSHSRKECKPGDWLEWCWRLGGWCLAKCIQPKMILTSHRYNWLPNPWTYKSTLKVTLLWTNIDIPSKITFDSFDDFPLPNMGHRLVPWRVQGYHLGIFITTSRSYQTSDHRSLGVAGHLKLW